MSTVQIFNPSGRRLDSSRRYGDGFAEDPCHWLSSRRGLLQKLSRSAFPDPVPGGTQHYTFSISPNQTHLIQLQHQKCMGQIRETSKMCTVGFPPGTGLGNTCLDDMISASKDDIVLESG